MIHLLQVEVPLSNGSNVANDVESSSRAVRRLLAPWMVYSSAQGRLPYFTRFLLTPGSGPGQPYLTGLRSAFRPAGDADWERWRLTLLAPGGAVESLLAIAAKFGTMPLSFWVMLPYPLAAQENRERLDALTAWTDGFMAHWNNRFAAGGSPLEGVVWGRESVPANDQPLVADYNRRIKAFGLQSAWLANFGGAGVGQWAESGFDAVALFSNYTGAGPYGVKWLNNALEYALFHGLGWQAVYGRGDRFRNGQETDYFEATAAYVRRGGAGPVVHRLIGLPPERLPHTHPGIYEGIYRVTRGLY